MDGSRCFRIALSTILIGVTLGVFADANELMVILVIIGMAGFFGCNYRYR
ncbi:MAG: hypothetical protein ABEH65_03060 [Halobacteriales archaeon]